MKKLITNIFILLAIAGMYTACKKATTPTALTFHKAAELTADQLAALRAYKKTKHEISFGWFGSSSYAYSPDMESNYAGLPDSMDLVSQWGGYPTEPAKLADMHSVQQNKGTKVVWEQFTFQLFQNFKLSASDANIPQLAQQIADTVKKYGMDGFEMDYEPFNNYCGCFDYFGDANSMALLVQSLGKSFGPNSGTGKLLIVDGSGIYGLQAATIPYFDYFIPYNYYASSYNSLPNSGLGNGIPNSKLIVTEDFQNNNAYLTGGVSFTTQSGEVVPSLWGMAAWEPTTGGNKGGAGAYILEGDYYNNPAYKYMRQAIQIMNPAKN
jgi:hypothetical protein